MELGIISSYVLLLVTLCHTNGINLSKKLEIHRAKRHTILDQSKLCKAFGCLNGYCKESEMRKYRIVCECFPGYGGKLCDRLKCPFPCSQHGTCARKGQALYCHCEPGFVGPRCESPAMPVHAIKPLDGHVGSPGGMFQPRGGMFQIKGPGGWFAHAPNNVKFSKYHSHAVVDMSVKPDICAPGFQCYHGVCDRKAINMFGTYQCLCKKSYTGLFCEKRCTLNCKNGGGCIVLDDGHQFCDCPFEFKGLLCEKRIHLG